LSKQQKSLNCNWVVGEASQRAGYRKPNVCIWMEPMLTDTRNRERIAKVPERVDRAEERQRLDFIPCLVYENCETLIGEVNGMITCLSKLSEHICSAGAP